MGTGTVEFDSFFHGTAALAADTDSAKFALLNEWALTHKGLPSPTVIFDARVYTTQTPIGLASGLRMQGAAGAPVREYARSTVIRYVKPPDPPGTPPTIGSLFRFGVKQTNQSYPSDGSPRDIHVAGIEFRGGSSADCVESVDQSADRTGKVCWYCEFHNCGWNGWRRVWWGFVNGGGITGLTHLQGFADTALWHYGSEARFFGRDGRSFMDSQLIAPGKPMIRTSVSKGDYGDVMVTGRKNLGPALHIDGGHGTKILGLQADAQDSDPYYGAQILVTGNPSDLVIGDGCFKGHMANPAAAPGGVARNRAVMQIEGGSGILIDRNAFERRGNSLPPLDTPLVFTGPLVPAFGVELGPNPHAGYTGVVQQSKPGQIVCASPTTSRYKFVTAA